MLSTFYPALSEEEIWSLSVFEIRRKSKKYTSVEVMFVRGDVTDMLVYKFEHRTLGRRF
jgi:hypothetical protein